MKKWLATYGNSFNEYPYFFREGDSFCLPMIDLSHKNDIIYIYFSDYRINQICFKCLIVETDLERNHIMCPADGWYDGFWCQVRILSVVPVGYNKLQNSVIENYGLSIVKINLSNFGNLFISACEISNELGDYLDSEFLEGTNLKNSLLLELQLRSISMRLSRDSEGNVTYSKYMMPNIHHICPSIKDSKNWIGELTLESRFCHGHFGPYLNLYDNGKYRSYTQREMSFSFWLNGSPDGYFSCTVYELIGNKIEEKKISWSGFEFAFRSLEHLLPFCQWIINLNLQHIELSDLRNLAYVKLYSSYSNREYDVSIIDGVYKSYNNCHSLLTVNMRREIINWFYDVFRNFPIPLVNEPEVISKIREFLAK